jgi:protoheme IX farnesyltransferase
MNDVAPGGWLRLTALAAAVATGAAVVSGLLRLGAGHEALAALGLPPLVALLVAARLAHRRLLPAALAAVVLFVAEIGLGGAVSVFGPPEWAVGLHLVVAALAFAAALVAAASTMRRPATQRSAIRDYVTLTKPRIMSLLLLTGACGYIVGAHGHPASGRLALTLLGLAMACGGASALNHVLDRDVDRMMGARTRTRPVAAQRMPPSHALEFGLALSAASFVLLAGVVNLLTAVLALAGNLFYVVVYTGLLKRRTPQNIVIGGAAGAVPPLVGWAAATGRLTLAAFLLFAVVFLWTPPHFWALALLLKEHYATARIPMLPVVAGDAETTRRIVRYSVGLVAFTLFPTGLGFGPLYTGAAAVLGVVFVALALRLRARPAARPAALLFHYSLLYLALLFAAAALDSVLA